MAILRQKDVDWFIEFMEQQGTPITPEAAYGMLGLPTCEVCGGVHRSDDPEMNLTQRHIVCEQQPFRVGLNDALDGILNEYENRIRLP